MKGWDFVLCHLTSTEPDLFDVLVNLHLLFDPRPIISIQILTFSASNLSCFHHELH